jgi:hypothetical protein
MHFGTDQQAGWVGNDMPLAAVDFLGRIETARAAGLGGLDRSTNNNASRGLGSRPAASRVCSNSSKLIRSNTPLSPQA